MQRALSSEQIEAFYHDEFVEDQTRHFVDLTANEAKPRMVVDVGGGCGFFAKRLSMSADLPVRVIDTDPTSIDTCRKAGLDARLGDALAPTIAGDEDIVCFNLILHHLVDGSGTRTANLQRRALEAWRSQVRAVFVNEYIYESYLPNASGWLIFQITKSRLLSAIGRLASKAIPAFKANTFGTGVRFRAHQEWVSLFEAAGYRVVASRLGVEEYVSLPLRLLLIKCIRRDSYLLRPITA